MAAYAYDSSRDDVIAEGVTVAGIDVGGHAASTRRGALIGARAARAARAADRGRARAASASASPPRTPGVHADVDGMVDEALAQEPRGQHHQPRRARPHRRRGARPGAGPRDLRRAGHRRPRQARRAAASTARRATPRSTSPSLEKVKERNGIAVQAALLRQRLAQALTVPGRRPPRQGARADHAPEGHPGRARRQVPGRCWSPTATTSSCASTSSCSSSRSTRSPSAPWASTRRPGSTTSRTRRWTPPGPSRTATGPATWPARSCPAGPDNPLKARWLGIFDGAGIHGTDETYSLGSAASHGCIRMAIPDVIELYDQVPVGAPIYIA